MQIPPVASIILAGCPQCEEPVVIFLGRAFPLSKAILMEGSIEERRDHILDVLTEVLAKGVDELMAQDALVSGMSAEPEYEGFAEETNLGYSHEDPKIEKGRGPIAQSEFDQFVLNDLDRLDDSGYFQSVFGQN
jgi:hypothetical protein